MTINTILKSDGPAIDEPVPSRYALNVGDIEILVISDGILPIPSHVLAHNVEPDVLDDWLDAQFLPREIAEWPLNVLVVRSGDQVILVDAGLGMDPNLKLEKAGRLVQRLEAAVIALSSITDVVITHMHMDHIGGLVIDGTHERLRSDLRVHVAAAEVEFWKDPDFSKTLMPQGFPDALRATAKRFMEQYGSQIRTFETEAQVAPGVTAQLTGGHTPGHCIVRVASRGDRLTFVGDAIFQVGFEQPEWFNGFEHDPEEAARVRIGLLRQFAETREAFVATHLPFPSIYHVAMAGDAFRAVPAVWDY
ncbi:MBL fold metallo-hydrolase [Sphingopyxis sp. JAI128]|uniref:MBL fold metallo-hydrolase n=1 Tax=Sphingopyxis sp. JAI128 TaxID=2723066 RepID=UPI0016135388|nr:MBL fold metallo-hydrolase [Sphingopyxis sp. JAI128]MBB6427118.1 glyoxylase-like metal-dependent hydrolase (beta-lactamase superfamily II) [Sphingopyxis sp. JAI128]